MTKEALIGVSKGRDQNGQNVFHRAASYHNLPILLNLYLEMEKDDDLRYTMYDQINAESKYGETPLLIACMLLHERGD